MKDKAHATSKRYYRDYQLRPIFTGHVVDIFMQRVIFLAGNVITSFFTQTV